MTVEFESDTKSRSRTSRFVENFKNLPSSKRRWTIFWSILIFVILPVAIPLGILAGSFFGLGTEKPPVDRDDTTGYATIEVFTVADNEIGYEWLNVTVALVNYDTEEVYDPELNVDGKSSVLLLEDPTFCYIYDVLNGTDQYQNYSFILFANDNEDNPFNNVVFLDQKTESGDLDAHIYDVDGVRGEYDVTDLTSSCTFILALNNTNANITIGEQFYVPAPFQPIEGLYYALWLETDGDIESLIMDGYNKTISTNGGLFYIVLPTLYAWNEIQLSCEIEFNSLPTYFKFYDGFATVSTDLVLTLS